MILNLPNINGNTEIHLDVLKAICGDSNGKSMIDIGSGNCPQTRLLGFKNKTYIDIIARNIHEEMGNFICGDIMTFVREFMVDKDVSLCLDCIEHFWEHDGREIIKWMEDCSAKQIIFTPLGRYMNIHDKEDKDPDTHKYSWTDKQFEEMGWAAITFPNFHPKLGEGGLGAFFTYKCERIELEFERIKMELSTKKWYKNE